MARPCKKRRICQRPQFRAFGPEPPTGRPPVTLTLEEYECLRLLDYEGLTQEECAAQMLVARTTVQALYASARKRLTAALVEGRPLHFAGGSYAFCREMPDLSCPFRQSTACPCPHHLPDDAKGPAQAAYQSIPYQKGVFPMKLAITYDENTQNIFQHFGKTQAFKVYTIADEVGHKKIISSEILPAGEAGHSALATLLQQNGVDTLICGGIGAGAQSALSSAGITLYGGASGNADKAAEDFLAGQLNYDPAVHCSHHEHHEHGQHGHGEHGCGHHGHGNGGQHQGQCHQEQHRGQHA